MDNRQKLFDYLKSQRLMSLATSGDGLSCCPVYYSIDNDFKIYFISEPDCEHSRNIKADGRVAGSISDTRQVVKDKKIGVQLRGVADEVAGFDRLEAILGLWNSTNPGIESVISLDNFRNKIIDSKAYKIEPTEIKFFNEDLYGEEGFELFRFDR